MSSIVGGALNSKIYEGWVRHRRFSAVENAFIYKVFMMYLDLDELDDVLALSRLWGSKKFSLARFSRADFLGDKDQNLKDAVLDRVEHELGFRPNGSVRLLANLRYFGYVVNPLTTYYCFDRDENLQAIVAEVNNTPWDERHAYVLPVDSQRKFHIAFDKKFHVSPFNPIAMQYQWYSNNPSDVLTVHLENWQHSSKVMDASMVLKPKAITASRLNGLLIRYPLMTVKVIGAIYWQAMKLWFKKATIYAHPGSVSR